MEFNDELSGLKSRLGDRLKSLRVARGLRQADFDEGEPSGVALSVYQSIESGKANPSLSTLFKISRKMNVSLEEIFRNLN